MTKPAFWLKPSIELVFAASLWGFGFIATVWALRGIDVPALIFYRFSLAFIAGAGIAFLVPQLRATLFKLTIIRSAFWPGLWLFLTIALQSWGLKTTTATKSAFITILYVVFVPILSYLLKTEKLNRLHFLSVVLALLGIAMFQNLAWTQWSFGDSLTLLCALAASIHILSVAKRVPTGPGGFSFSLWQSFWTAIFALLIIPWSERNSIHGLDFLGGIGLLTLAFGSGLLAFYLQVRAQQKIGPSLASVLFLLESPFSAVFAFYFLDEKFKTNHFIGACTILLACGLAISASTRKKK